MIKLVMIVDDSATVRKIVETCLKRAGVATISYPNGVDALRSLRDPQHPQPDIFILDVNMPQIDGYSVARLIRAMPAFKRAAIIMLTSRNGRIDRLRGRLAGATSYMGKPFHTRELLATIAKYGELPEPQQ